MQINKKTLIIIISAIVAGVCLLAVWHFINIKYSLIEYPLAKVNVNDDSEYLLIKKYWDSEEKFEAVTDTKAIKTNQSAFKIYYKFQLDKCGCSPYAFINLYKDGALIESIELIEDPIRRISYGTLRFVEIDEAQYLSLLGKEDKN